MAILHQQDREIEKQHLRTAIARSRRRIDQRVRQSGGAARQIVSWKACVARNPAAAIAAAFGLGWFLAAGLPRSVLAGVVRQASDEATGLLWQELRRIWATASRSAESTAEGVDNA